VRQRNETGGVLNSPDYGGPIGPGEEFEHDVLITGCTDLDAPETPDEPPEPDPPADVPAEPDEPAATEEPTP
jgi:hypothetical protein